MKKERDEPVLPDDYIVYADYLYVVDDILQRSDWHGITVKEYKARIGAKEIRRCDIVWRRQQQEIQ